jgi:ketosteroid isomerase-like protein
MTDEQQIQSMIETWAAAIDRGEFDGAVADRTGDVVMFDVPPPHDGIRGIDAYRQAWPPFLDWQRNGGCFELVAVEVTAGTDVAFAHALLRCSTRDDLTANPGKRLRITLGLRKEGDRWLVAHEHHSFPLAVDPQPAAE